MTRTSLILLLLFYTLLINQSLAGGTNYWEGKGRIAVSSDGNKHDNDDMQATMMTLMILAKAQLQDNTVLYSYADHVWGSEDNDLQIMKESAEGGGERFGFQSTKFMAAVSDPEAAYNAMRDEILKSTSDDPLFVIAAGPMQVIGEALNRANETNAEALNFVTVISHSNWNNRHSDNPEGAGSVHGEESPHSGWTWDEMNASFGSRVNFNKISDQNGTGDQPYKTKDKFSAPAWSSWHWMRDHKDHNVQWVYTKGLANPGGPDYSDAGMAYYFCADLNGERADEFGNPEKLEAWIGPDVIPVEIDPTRVNSVSLDNNSYHIKEVNGTVQLSATVSPSTATDQSLSWKSSDDAIAAVSESGLVTGHSIGNATITVTTTDNSKTATSNIQVGDVPPGTFYAGDNYISFEAESTNSELGEWVIRRTGDSDFVEGTSGVAPINGTYLEYTGGVPSGLVSAGKGILVYKFTPVSTGTYRLTGRMAQNQNGEAWDRCNDIYVKMKGDFEAGAGSATKSQLETFAKFYGRGLEDWGAFVQGEINHLKYSMKYNLKAGEEYTFTVSGRSQRVCIDYYLFVKEGPGITIGEKKDLATHTPSYMIPGGDPVSGCYTIKAHDFDNVNVDGFDPATKGTIPNSPADGINKGEKVIGCGGTNGINQPIAAEEIYTGIETDALFTLKAVLEPDGECTYSVYVNDVMVGEKQASRIFGTDIPPYSYEDLMLNDSTVAIKSGDVIRVTSNQVSNNLVPEGDGFATARGRWVSLDICGDGIVSRPEGLGFVDFPKNILNTETQLAVKVSYTANEVRDIYAGIHNPAGDLLESLTKSVEIGSGETTLEITIDSEMALGEDYSVQIALRPEAGDETTNIIEKTSSFNVVDALPPNEDLIDFIDLPSQLSNSQLEIPVEVAYTASEERYINVAIYTPENGFITNARADIDQGSGEVTITLVLDNALTLGSGYKVDLSIRPLGGDWSTNIDNKNQYVEVVENVAGEQIAVSGISISTENIRLDKTGAKHQLVASVSPSNATNKKINWSSSNENIATVNTEGIVTAVDNGSARITAKSEDGGHETSTSVSVAIAVTQVSIDPNTVSFEAMGESQQLTATISPDNALNQNATWASADELIAFVDQSGLVSAVGEGTTIITVTTEDGAYAAEADITVTQDASGSALSLESTEDANWIFPNPSSGILNVRTKQSSKITVFNSAGVILQSKTAVGDISIFDLSGIKMGVYFVSVENQFGKKISRLVKTNYAVDRGLKTEVIQQ